MHPGQTACHAAGRSRGGASTRVSTTAERGPTPSLAHPRSQPCGHNPVAWTQVNSPVLGRPENAVQSLQQAWTTMTVKATANARTPGSSGGRDVGREVRREAAPPTGRRLPPCPADLLEPLHQPGGQSWRNVEQESLLLQLPQGRCKPVGQDLAVATPGTGTGVKTGDPLPRKAQSPTALTGHCRCR